MTDVKYEQVFVIHGYKNRCMIAGWPCSDLSFGRAYALLGKLQFF